MNSDSAHHSKWEIAEVVFGGPFLIAIALDWIIPFSAPSGIPGQLLVPIGIILIIAGIALIVLARREFARYRQPTDPGQPTSQVIKTGIFSISRNPLYFASILVFLGIALALNILWGLVAVLVSTIVCHYILIIPEEKYLSARFGAEYLDYAAAVHRWLGRK